MRFLRDTADLKDARRCSKEGLMSDYRNTILKGAANAAKRHKR